MGIGVSILLIAIGAVLTWAVERSVTGIEVSTIGVILMVVGGVGVIASLLVSSSVPWRGGAVVDDRAPDDTDEPYTVPGGRR